MMQKTAKEEYAAGNRLADTAAVADDFYNLVYGFFFAVCLPF